MSGQKYKYNGIRHSHNCSKRRHDENSRYRRYLICYNYRYRHYWIGYCYSRSANKIKKPTSTDFSDQIKMNPSIVELFVKEIPTWNRIFLVYLPILRRSKKTIQMNSLSFHDSSDGLGISQKKMSLQIQHIAPICNIDNELKKPLNQALTAYIVFNI